MVQARGNQIQNRHWISIMMQFQPFLSEQVSKFPFWDILALFCPFWSRLKYHTILEEALA
jgi:hypothetical protein